MAAARTLKISDSLRLPIDAATQTFGILATKGAGKSNAAVVMAEAMWDAGVPWVAVDPKGDWWGVRSSGDGKGPGLPIVVFGGRHGDVPLEATAGHLIASIVLEQRLTCVLDVSQFTKAETVRFLLAFGTYLFRHADDDAAEPLHLFLEEAHEYLPQQVSGDVAQLVNAWQRIVKQGRFKGLGCTLISQRSSSLNKDVLELIDTLIVLRTVGPRSREAVKAWVKDQDVDAGLLASLPTLAAGEAWIWSPGALGLMERIRFLRRRTFDSGATPKVGEARRAPATLADVDLAALKEQMADTIERAQADDPKLLRRRIAELERLAGMHERQMEEAVKAIGSTVIEVPIIDERTEFVMTELAGKMIEIAANVREFSPAAAHTTSRVQGEGVARKAPTPPASTAAPSRPERATRTQASSPDQEVNLKAGARKILGTLGRHHPMRVTRAQLGTLTGFKITGGTFQTYYSTLKRAGLIDDAAGLIGITERGLDLAGVAHTEPLTTAEVLDQWRGALKRGARDMLDIVIAAHPGSVTRSQLAEQLGMAESGGTFQTYLSTLRRNGLVDVDAGEITASGSLFLGGRP